MRAGLRCAGRALVPALSAVALTAAVTVAVTAATADDPRRSGFDFMSPSTQAMQRDDSANPAFLWLQDGRQRFQAECARCHTPASLAGVAARYPAWDRNAGKAFTLADRINACRVRHVRAAALPFESEPLLAIEAFVAHASRGQPIVPAPGAPMDAVRTRGEQLYRQPFGQLSMSCTMCHDRHAGQRLAGSPVPQGHPTAYPLYRLEWQTVGSLQRRLRHCMSGVRAEPFAFGSQELTALEAYLMQRAAGMRLESPGVRP
jgi:L-cysteine S-thiosulfotransferase